MRLLPTDMHPPMAARTMPMTRMILAIITITKVLDCTQPLARGRWSSLTREL